MPMLRTNDLYRMRQEQLKYLPGTAVIYRATLVSDGMGGQEETWSPIGTASCRIMPRKIEDREFPAGSQLVSKMAWVVTLPHGTAVKAEDLIKIGSRTYEIISVNNDQSYQTAVRVDVISYNEEELI